MDIDVQAMLVVLLPLDALSYEEANLRDQLENLCEVVP